MWDDDRVRVLVAEDERPVREILGIVLGEREDCDVHFANDGEDAIAFLSRFQPDVLITDLAMPRVGGYELTARALGLFPDLTILVETGNATLNGTIDLLRRGVADVVMKPFSIPDLTERIDRAISKSRAGRERSQAKATVAALLAALEAKDPYLRGHSERVSSLAPSLGRLAGVEESSIGTLAWAALVHDLGKIGVRESVLNKPGKLTDEEYAEVKKHPVLSAEIVRPIAHLQGGEDALNAVYHHHERIDGRGYPDGISGDEIPLFARIIAVCDCWDALIGDRPYRAALPPAEAREILYRARHDQLDARLVDLFLDHLGA